MAQNSKIEWTAKKFKYPSGDELVIPGHTHNEWIGCQRTRMREPSGSWRMRSAICCTVIRAISRPHWGQCGWPTRAKTKVALPFFKTIRIGVALLRIPFPG